MYLCNAFGKCIASVGGGSAKAKQACLCIRLAPPLQSNSEEMIAVRRREARKVAKENTNH